MAQVAARNLVKAVWAHENAVDLLKAIAGMPFSLPFGHPSMRSLVLRMSCSHPRVLGFGV